MAKSTEQPSAASTGQADGSLVSFLNDRSIDFHSMQLGQQPEHALLVQGSLMKDVRGFILLLHARDHVVDYPELCRSLSRDLEFIPPDQSPFAHHFDEHLASYPALPEYLKVQGLVDEDLIVRLKKETQVYFAMGQSGALVVMDTLAYDHFLEAVWVLKFSLTEAELPKPVFGQKFNEEKISALRDTFSVRRLKSRIKQTFEVPVMPPMADELLKLRVNPAGNARSLARLVEKDPSLSAQLISWSRSPYYGFAGKITSVDDAIIKVLGFELVMNIALGIAIGQIMKVPTEGPLGLQDYWRHSVLNASLIEKLLPLIPTEIKPYRGLAYLCGLLHNFGHLLLGQVFPPQFHLLQQSLYLNPKVCITSIEQHLFDTCHASIGAWLMEAWNMPAELHASIAYHHDVNYTGEFADYAALVMIANCLLASKHIGDSEISHIPEQKLALLSLQREQVEEVFHEFWQHSEELEEVVKLLVGTDAAGS